MSGAMHPPDPEEPRPESGEARPPSDGEEQASAGGASTRRPEVLEKGAVYDRSRQNTERLIRENRNFVADYVDSFAHGLGAMARTLEGEGRSESATQIDRAAGELERASKKVREESLVKTARQAEARARERPLIAFGGAALAGFALSRVLKSRPAHDDGQED